MAVSPTGSPKSSSTLRPLLSKAPTVAKRKMLSFLMNLSNSESTITARVPGYRKISTGAAREMMLSSPTLEITMLNRPVVTATAR